MKPERFYETRLWRVGTRLNLYIPQNDEVFETPVPKGVDPLSYLKGKRAEELLAAEEHMKNASELVPFIAALGKGRCENA